MYNTWKKQGLISGRKIWCGVKLYNEWRDYRVPVEIRVADLNTLYSFTEKDFTLRFGMFHKKSKEGRCHEYPPQTLREIIVTIQMCLHENSITWKLLESQEFVALRCVVYNIMKERTALGLGVRQSSDIISLAHEDILFASESLGEDTPIQLLRTVIYMIGIHCALRGDVEHQRLRRPGFNSQFSLSVDDRGIESLVYKEDPLQKTNQGGLTNKPNNKVVHIYPAKDTARCPVCIFKKYVNLLPTSKSCNRLYLRCRPKPTPKCWFSDQA